MAVQFVGTTSGSATAGANVAITYPGPFKSSDVAIVTVAIGSSVAATLAVASSSGATTFYTQIVTTIRTSNVSYGVFRRVIASTAEQAISITGTAGALSATTGAVHIFRGVNPTTPEDVTPTSTNGGSTTPTPLSITPVTFGCGIIASVGIGTQISALLTGPAGFLNFQSTTGATTDPGTVGQAWIGNGSTSPKTPGTFTSSATSTWAVATIALRPIGRTSAEGDPWAPMGEDSDEYVVREALKTVIRSY